MISRFTFAISLLLIFNNLFAKPFFEPRPGDSLQYIIKDSIFSLNIHLRFQTLYEGNFNSDNNQWSDKLLIRRARIKFDGFAYIPGLKYKVELGLSNRDIGNISSHTNKAPRIILDAFLKYNFCKHWELWFGQTKLPGNRERIISSQDLQFVDRSLLNSSFNIDRDIGLQLHHNNYLGQAYMSQKLSISMGEGRNITSENIGGYDYTARLEIFPFGKFLEKKGAYSGGDLIREAKPKLAFAVAYDFNSRAGRAGGQLGKFVVDSLGNTITNSLSTLFLDAMFKYQGWSIMSEFAYKTVKDRKNNTFKYQTGRGFNLQSGYLFNRPMIELAFRYTSIQPKKADTSGLKVKKEYTMAISKYISGHNLKIQSDISFLKIENHTNNIRCRLQVEIGL